MTSAELQRIKDRIDLILDSHLCEMREGEDDSVAGFNKAWDIVRDIFAEEIGRTHHVLSASPLVVEPPRKEG